MTDTETYEVEEDWCETYSGVKVRFMSPTPDMVRIEDVAHQLGNICRYNGGLVDFYSVAEHSCLMRDALAAAQATPRLRLTALLHDAAEIVLGDMNRPVKQKFPLFKELEGRFDAAVAEKFGTIHPFPDVIREYDARMLATERRQGKLPSGNGWGSDGLESLPVTLHFWSPRRATSEFLRRFREDIGIGAE